MDEEIVELCGLTFEAGPHYVVGIFCVDLRLIAGELRVEKRRQYDIQTIPGDGRWQERGNMVTALRWVGDSRAGGPHRHRDRLGRRDQSSLQ